MLSGDSHDRRWFNVVPFFSRGSEFQVHADRSASVRGDDSWEPLLKYQYSTVTDAASGRLESCSW